MGVASQPTVPELLRALERAYEALIVREGPPGDEGARLLAVADDLAWYGERFGPANWGRAPRAGAWDFAAILRHLTEQAVRLAEDADAPPVRYFIDHGKEHVGQVAELWFLLDLGAAGGSG